VISERGGEIEVRDEDDELLRAAEELGIDLTPGSLRVQARDAAVGEIETGGETPDGDRELDVPADETLVNVSEDDELDEDEDEDDEAATELDAELAPSAEVDE
jgi:DNA-directed RNA polymerase subunit beta